MGLVQTGNAATIGDTDLIQEALILFNKKFKNFCSKSPLRLSYFILSDSIKVSVENKDKEFVWPLTFLQQLLDNSFDERILKGENVSSFKIKNEIVEAAVKQFVYEIRLKLASSLPVLLYRKFNLRQLTPEEIANQMISKKEEEKVQTHVYDLVKEKTFVMEQVFLAKSPDNPKSLFSLSDEDGVRHLYKFKTGLVMPFLYKMWNNKLTPAELGKEFFTQAKLVSKKGDSIEQ